MRERIYELVGPAGPNDIASRIYDYFVVFIALLSIVPLVFEYAQLPPHWMVILETLDYVTAYILLLDYMLRWMTHDIKTGKGYRAYITYPLKPMAIIDILAILPTFGILPQTMRFLRILRIVKVFRYSRNLVVVTNACAREAKTLTSVFLAVIMYMFAVALIIYAVEPESFTSYFDALCWSATQLTSVTYNQGVTHTSLGTSISILSSLVGLLLFALPAGVITGAYISEIREAKRDRSYYFHMAGPAWHTIKFEKPSIWLKKNRKVLRYLTIMVLMLAIELVLCFVYEKFNLPYVGDNIPIAAAAFLLEPAAGIITGFLCAMVGGIFFHDAASIASVAGYVIVAAIAGHLMPRKGERHFLLRLIGAMAAIVVCCSTVNLLILFALAQGDASAMAGLICHTFNANDANATLLPQFGPVVTSVIILASFYAVDATILGVVFIILFHVLGIEAAPSSAERAQQQKIALERTLKYRNERDLEALAEAEEALTTELRKLERAQVENDKRIRYIGERLAVIRGESPEEDEQ